MRRAAAAGALIAEVWRSALSQRAASILAVVALAVMAGSTLLTSGRAVAAEDDVLSRIDSAGSRSVVARSDPGTGLLTSDVVAAAGRIREVETAVGLSGPVQVQPVVAARGTSVGLRTMLVAGDQVPVPASPDTLLGSQDALDALGFADGYGAVVDEFGRESTVIGPVDLPAAAAGLEPLLVRPVAEGSDGAEVFGVVVVVARTPGDVASVTQTLSDLIAASDPRQVTLETSQDIAALRSSVAGTLSEHSRSSIVRSLAASVIVVAATMSGLVVLRRRDFGRRRALGASRGLIIAILEIQTALLGIAGATTGAVVALVTLALQGAPLPNLAYCVAVVLLSVVVALAGALLPALYAATRDPLVELRMP